MPTPTLNPEEFQYGDTGMLLNGSVALPFVDLTKIAGLDSTDIRSVTHDREGQNGGYLDSQYETLRTVTLEGTIYAAVTAMETYLDQLKANYAPRTTAQALYFGTDAGVRAVFGKPLGIKYDKDALRRLGKAEMQVQVVCEDRDWETLNV